jgi:enoyl-CoA hydratase/carnithine racemase
MSNAYKHLEIEPKGDFFIVTLQNGEDNRLNFAMCKELMHALGAIRDQLKPGSDGALIVRGHNYKFFTNVRYPPFTAN